MTTKFIFLLLLVIFYFCSGEERRKRFSIRAADTQPKRSPNDSVGQKEPPGTSSNHTRKIRQFGELLPSLTKQSPNVLQSYGLFSTGDLNEKNTRIQPGVNDISLNVPATTAKVPSTSTITDAFYSRLSTPTSSMDKLLGEEFNAFKDEFRRKYPSPQEELLRKQVFIQNKKKVLLMNEEFGVGKHPFVVKLNDYADLLNYEYNKIINGFGGGNQTRRGSSFIPRINVEIPISVDWREKGAVTSVKNQELCGADYAFSAAGAIEGQIFRKTGKLRDLSVQNLIDCTRGYGNNGCTNGYVDPVFEYVTVNQGIEAEATYPFEATENGVCRYRPENSAVRTTGYIDLNQGDESVLEQAVASLGPISAVVDASLESFQFYGDGVYFDSQCQNDPDKVNHAVLVVGYGAEPDGQQYWLIKNSYGPHWGIGGYMKLAKFAGNHCGIATYASFPLV